MTIDETMSTMTKHSTVQRRNPLNFLLTQSQQLAAILTMGLYFQYFVYRTERLMDSYLREHTFLQQLRDSVAPSPEEVKPRYLVFRKTPQGQGIGNIMNGLLAAHMLGRIPQGLSHDPTPRRMRCTQPEGRHERQDYADQL